MLLYDSEARVDATFEPSHDLRVRRGWHERFQKSVANEVAAEFVIIEHDPAEYLSSLTRSGSAELTMLFGKVMQDHARLAQNAVSILQHRHFAHLIERPSPIGTLGRALHVIYEDWLPRSPKRVEHHGDFETVTD